MATARLVPVQLPPTACQRILAVAVLVWAASGCAVGPDFVRPAAPSLDHYSTIADPVATVSGDGQSQRILAGTDVASDWWRVFQSPDLNSMVTTGLQNSPTVAAALATLKQSEANLEAGKGVFYPELDLGFSFARQKISPLRQGLIGPAPVFGLYTLSTAVSYVLDVFGGERRTVEGLAAQVDAQRATVRVTYLTLIGNIINTAFAEAAYRAQVEATERLIALQQQQLAIVETQVEAGLVSAANVVAAESQLAANEAILPTIRQRQAAAEDLLATLVGYAPADAKLPKLLLSGISLPADLPLSLPSALVRQRPDILVAEANLHVASAQVGVATAALFPTFTLSGNYGRNAQQFNNLGDAGNSFWNVGPTMAFPVFQGGGAWYRKDAAAAGYEAALAKYRQTVLDGFGQVADTLHALANDAEVAAARRQALHMTEVQRELVEANHAAGLVSDLEILAARQQVETATVAMIDATTQRYQDTVALYVALGGGWWNADCQEDALRSSHCGQPQARSGEAAVNGKAERP